MVVMRRQVLLPAAYLFDSIAGDPEWFPHPVRLIGWAISRGESLLRRTGKSNAAEFSAGALLTAAIVGSTYWTTRIIIRSANHHSRTCGNETELLLAWTCLAARNLEEEASSVTTALRRADLPVARQRLARIVGRDTAALDSSEISRALIETVAESASDGIIAPMFYMALGGVPLAMAYKAINTLDSIIGHADDNYFYFGKTAARLDDAANYLPSRISALAVIAASLFVPQADAHAAWRVWQRDGAKHKSPNAGQPESATAGALHVALGGDNTYAGELISAQRMGDEFPPATPRQALQTLRLVSIASLLTLGTAILLTSLLRTRKNG